MIKEVEEKDMKTVIGQIPLTSGVYLMKNNRGKVIYVGKAVSLRKRVQSYFRLKPHMNKTDALVANVADIDYMETVSEAEALILEASLIKEHDPKYNVMLRDDKSYPFIQVTKEEFSRISIERPRTQESKPYLLWPLCESYINT